MTSLRGAADSGQDQHAPAAKVWARRVLPDLAVGGGLCLLLWISFHRLLELWWSHDDFAHLHYLAQHSAWEYCLRPDVWRLLQGRMLTPLLFLSLHFDFLLAGANPVWFYAHQLIAAALAITAFYAVLRLWLPVALSGTATATFLLGLPTASVIALLMTRHYVEGLITACASLGLLVWAERHESRGACFASALFYLGACLTKEIFVPLIALLVLIPRGPASRKLRRSGLHLALFGLYLGWRFYMLGTWGAGYGRTVTLRDWPDLILSLPHKLFAAVSGETVAASSLLLACFLLAALALCASSRFAIGYLLLGALIALGPVLPVSTEMEPRYAFPAWIVASAILGFGCDALRRRGGRWTWLGAGLAILALLNAAAVFHAGWGPAFDRLRRVSGENRALLTLPAGNVLRLPVGPPTSLHELQWFRESYLGLPRGAGWFCDDFYLCSAREDLRVVQYDALTHRVVDLGNGAAALRQSFCGTIRDNAALTVSLSHAGDSFFWRLGPYTAGDYTLVFNQGVEAYAVPSAGGFHVPSRRTVTLRVRYRSPSGWNTYSPELSFDFEKSSQLRFARPAMEDR